MLWILLGSWDSGLCIITSSSSLIDFLIHWMFVWNNFNMLLLFCLTFCISYPLVSYCAIQESRKKWCWVLDAVQFLLHLFILIHLSSFVHSFLFNYHIKKQKFHFFWDQHNKVNFGCKLWYISQHDAACRVIARLKKERDEARSLLAQSERQIPMSMSTATAVNASALSNGKRGSCFTSRLIFF